MVIFHVFFNCLATMEVPPLRQQFGIRVVSFALFGHCHYLLTDPPRHMFLGAMVCESQTKRHGGCARHVNEDIYTCTIPNIYSIVDVDVLRVRRPRGTSCTHHAGAIPDTYTTDMPGVYHFCGDQITVAGGCRAVFNVTFDVCVNGDSLIVLLTHIISSY